MTSEQLQGAVAANDPGSDPSPMLPATTGFGPVDQARILKTIGLDPADPRAHAVVLVAERYGLDPVLNHVLILPKSQRPYITLDGFRHVAHTSGVYDGMTVTDGPRRDGAEREWVATVAVWRKDMTRPFEFPGRAGINLDNGPEMALARAKRRSLREAFDITVPKVFAEDEWDATPWVPPAAEPGQPGGPLSEDQRVAILAGFRDRGMDSGLRLRLISEWLGRRVTSVKNLTAFEADQVLARLTARRDVDAGPEPGGDAPFPDAPTPAPVPDEPRPITKAQRNQITGALEAAGITDAAQAMELISHWLGRTVANTAEVEADELDKVLGKIATIGQEQGEPEGGEEP